MHIAAEIEGGDAAAHVPAGANLEDVEAEKLQEIDFDDGGRGQLRYLILAH